MVLNIVSVALMLVLAFVLMVIARRFWRSKQAVLKWLGGAAFGLGSLGLLAALVVGLFGFYQLNAVQSNAIPSVKVAGTPAQVARGQQLANLCLTCHASAGRLPLDGGGENLIKLPPIGTLVGPNLTPGGGIKDWSDGEVIRSIREGVGKTNRPLLGMPSWSFRYLGDDDVQSLAAYLRSQPAVQHATPARDLNLLAGMAVGARLAPSSAGPAITAPVIPPPRGASAQYGEYLVAFSGCRDCHGDKLAGKSGLTGLLSATPNGPNLPIGAQILRKDGLDGVVRRGTYANGQTIDPKKMPWSDFAGAYTDADVAAIYEYLSSLPATGAAAP